MGKTVVSETMRSGTIANDDDALNHRAIDMGPRILAAQVVAGGTWGTSPAIATPTGGAKRGRVGITSGTGTPDTTATLTVTFPGPAFRTAPRVFLRQVTGADLKAVALPADVTTTTFVIKVGTAAAASTLHEFEYVVLPA